MHHRQFLVIVCAWPLFGCADSDWFSEKLDPKTEPTYRFWVSLHDIHQKDFPGIRQRLDEMKAAIQKSEADRAAELLQELAAKHQQIAERLSRLGHENVDGEVLVFRDQLVSSHRSLDDACKKYSTALKDEDSEVIRSTGSRFVKLYENLADLWGTSTEVIESLEAKYGRDFNVQL